MLTLIFLLIVVVGCWLFIRWITGTISGSGPAKVSPVSTSRPAPPVPPARRPPPGWVCALDLGTHASKAAVWTPGETPRTIRFGSARALPSAVGLDAEGRWLTGVEAVTFAETYPSAVLRNPKAEVLRREVVLDGPGGRWRVATPDLLAATLAVLYRAVAADCPPGRHREIVLTHPVAWTDTPAIDVLLDARQRAGLPDVPITLVAEPVAAAAWFERQHPDVTGSGAPFIVVDIGGGSLDVALLRRGPGGLQVLDQPVGRTDVGGTALDAALLAGAGELWGRRNSDRWRRLRDEPGPEWHAARRTCHENSRIAKENLTALHGTGLLLSSPYWREEVTITRSQFELWIEEIVWVAVRAVDAVCATNMLGRNVPVFLSGGSSRIPFLRAQLSGLGFAVIGPDGSGGPAELNVVCGAALQGQELRYALHG